MDNDCITHTALIQYTDRLMPHIILQEKGMDEGTANTDTSDFCVEVYLSERFSLDSPSRSPQSTM